MTELCIFVAAFGAIMVVAALGLLACYWLVDFAYAVRGTWRELALRLWFAVRRVFRSGEQRRART